MTEGEMLKLSVEEFSRLQQYMRLTEKDSEAYKAMKIRYIELKVILSSSGVNLTELDMIKECLRERTGNRKSVNPTAVKDFRSFDFHCPIKKCG